jgi:hypothetical protein
MIGREPAVAGYFYPSSRSELVRSIESLFSSELGPGELPSPRVEGPRKIFGLISPHAGYMYSGSIASYGYLHLSKDGLPSRIIIIGPNHTGMGGAISIFPRGYWKLPLGVVEVDDELAEALHKKDPFIDLDGEAHLYEHSIEVQIPFLQYIYEKVDRSFKILPIVMMHQTWSGVQALGNALTEVLGDMPREEYILIASTDFTHYESASSAEKKDKMVIERILDMDPHGLIETVYKYNISMCGYGPVATLLYVASNLGVKKSILLKYGSSGDVTGDYSNVVAYASLKLVWHE